MPKVTDNKIPAGWVYHEGQRNFPEASATTSVPQSPSPSVPVNAKSWGIALALSIFLGPWGIDRFYLGHIGSGVLKMLVSFVTMSVRDAAFVFILWWVIGILLIATKYLKDSKGRRLV